MAEEKTEVKAKKQEPVKTLVVAQLPTQPYNKLTDESGVEYNLMTVEEALTRILENSEKLVKGLI